jgi:hypothetical protein
MRRLLPLALLLVGACGAAPPPTTEVPAAQREMNERMGKLRGEIDELMGRYETLVKQSAAIEQLLARLGFSAQMSVDTVAQRVELMRRFEQAEAARTAAHDKLKGLLKTLAAQHHIETYVEVRNGQIVVHLAEGALFDAKRGHLRAEATPLLWAVAEGLKELAGRRFEVVAEVTPAAPEPAPAAKGQARPKPARRGKTAAPPDPWANAAQRAAAVVRVLEGAGLGAERLAAVERLPDPTAAHRGSGRFIEIIVLPTREELPRVHGTQDAALAPLLAPPEKAPPAAPAVPPAPPPASKVPGR